MSAGKGYFYGFYNYRGLLLLILLIIIFFWFIWNGFPYY